MDTSPSEPCAEFARRLRRIRLERGLSQERLAHMAGLDRTYVSSCEAGRRNATLKTVERLAVALGVDPALLVSDHCGELPPPV